MKRGHMKPKREKWAKHRVHCACGDALQEVLAALGTQRRVNQILAAVTDTLLDGKTKLAVIATLSSRLALESISSDYGLAVDGLLAKYATVLHEKGGAPNTQTSLNPGVNKGRRDSRKPKHTTSGTTNLAGPQVSHAWLDNRCARCGHEHEGPCPFCECAEHVEPVDPYDAEVERALEDAARNPSL